MPNKQIQTNVSSTSLLLYEILQFLTSRKTHANIYPDNTNIAGVNAFMAEFFKDLPNDILSHIIF